MYAGSTRKGHERGYGTKDGKRKANELDDPSTGKNGARPQDPPQRMWKFGTQLIVSKAVSRRNSSTADQEKVEPPPTSPFARERGRLSPAISVSATSCHNEDSNASFATAATTCDTGGGGGGGGERSTYFEKALWKRSGTEEEIKRGETCPYRCMGGSIRPELLGTPQWYGPRQPEGVALASLRYNANEWSIIGLTNWDPGNKDHCIVYEGVFDIDLSQPVLEQGDSKEWKERLHAKLEAEPNDASYVLRAFAQYQVPDGGDWETCLLRPPSPSHFHPHYCSACLVRMTRDLCLELVQNDIPHFCLWTGGRGFRVIILDKRLFFTVRRVKGDLSRRMPMTTAIRDALIWKLLPQALSKMVPQFVAVYGKHMNAFIDENILDNNKGVKTDLHIHPTALKYSQVMDFNSKNWLDAPLIGRNRDSPNLFMVKNIKHFWGVFLPGNIGKPGDHVTLLESQATMIAAEVQNLKRAACAGIAVQPKLRHVSHGKKKQDGLGLGLGGRGGKGKKAQADDAEVETWTEPIPRKADFSWSDVKPSISVACAEYRTARGLRL